MSTKQMMLVNRRQPFGSAYALESLDVALMSAAFNMQLSVAFIDDGVLQLLAMQQGEVLGMKNFSKAFLALADFGVEHIYVSLESLQERGLQAEQLMSVWFEPSNPQLNLVQVISDEALAVHFAEQDVLLNF